MRRYRFDSGLRAIVANDDSVPIVSLQMWYGVGARHSKPDTTGIAHFLEHLMFGRIRQSSWAFRLHVQDTGGHCNAATSFDWTQYRSTVPSDRVGMVAELEAKRMVGLVLDDHAFDTERDVILNERRQSNDDDAGGFAYEQLQELAFREHPYRWPVIGLPESLLAMSVFDVRRFYRDYYTPSNVCAVLVGDIGYGPAIEILEEAFSPLPVRAVPPDDVAAEPEQTEQRSARFERPIEAPLVLIGYKVPPLADRDWLNLALLACVLSHGPSSRLHRRLVDDRRVASWIRAFPTRTLDPFLLSFAMQPAHGVEPQAVIAELDAELEQLASHGPDHSDVLRAINGLMTSVWMSMEDTEDIASRLGEYEMVAGDFRQLAWSLDRLPTVDARQLWKTARAYLSPSRRSIVTVVPGDAA